MKNIKNKFHVNPKIAVIVGIILVALLVLIATNPGSDAASNLISADIKASSGSNFAAYEYNFGVVSVARGANIRTAASETYIGFFGNVYPANEGGAKTAGDILLWLPQLGSGAVVTIELTIVSMAAGIVLGIFLALGKISKFKPVSAVCTAYVFFFRGTPLLMQLYFIYYGLPTISPNLVIQSKFIAAFISFSLNFGAYCAELVRAAIQSIDKGQFEASKALGLTHGQAMGLVVLPQTVRRLIPPMSNEFIMALKDVSLVSVIALMDLTGMTRSIQNAKATVLVFIPAMIIYLIITAVFTFIFHKIEKRFSLYE
ncbi:hypothetical protein FACS189499_05100 [Clostridia bacterium]|nr:hypothetical protein FACS189499_05100 [Clostridia bacterium]